IFPSVDILYDWLGWNSRIFLTTKDLLVVGATIPLMLGLQYFVTRTTWGKAMRATAQDRETAQAMGINVDKTIILTFLLGWRLAGGGERWRAAAESSRGCTTTSASGTWDTRRGCARSPPRSSAASGTCRARLSAGSSSDSCPRGATSTSPPGGPTPSSSPSSF